MKWMICAIFTFAAVAGSNTAQADEACSEAIQAAVGAQAIIDFPGELLSVDLPDTSDSTGGSVSDFHVAVRRFADDRRRVLATYYIQTNEVCAISAGPTLETRQ